MNLELTWRAGVLATSISSTFENHLLKTAKYAYRKAGDRRGTINEPALREFIRTPINGKNYSEHIWGNVDKLAEDLREVFRCGFIRGLNPREMAQEIAKKYNVARSRAQTIIRTDGTAIISNSVAKRYMDAGLKYYRILVHLDDRTTDICRHIAKEDKRYELSEMKTGLNAPPFHYNCRSGIVPDEEELDGELNEPVEDRETSELEDSHKGINRKNQINRSVINSASYRRKFDALDENIKITRKIYSESKAMLKHRNGTEFEDLAFINALTGEVRVSKHENTVRSVSPTAEMVKMLKGSEDGTIIAIHNHPGSSVPSIGDLNVAFQRKYKYGIVVAHDGTVFRYQVNGPVDPQTYNSFVVKLDKKGYNEDTLKVFANELARIGVTLEAW